MTTEASLKLMELAKALDEAKQPIERGLTPEEALRERIRADGERTNRLLGWLVAMFIAAGIAVVLTIGAVRHMTSWWDLIVVPVAVLLWLVHSPTFQFIALMFFCGALCRFSIPRLGEPL
jgi:hypothetical protein